MKKALGCFGWLMVIIMGIKLLVLLAPLALVISIFAWWYFNKKGNEKYVTAAKLSTVISALGAVFFIYAINSPTEPETATTLVEQSSSIEQVDKQPEETTEEVAEQTEETEEDVSEEETEETEELEEESESNEEKTLEEVDAEPVEEKSEPISSEDEGILPPEFALSLMESSFEGIANVTYSSEYKAFLIEPTDQEIKTALVLLLEGSTPEINASWELLKDSFVSASNSIKDSVGAGYQIHLLNPMNNENSLLIVTDGVVIYDAFSQ